MFCHKNERRRVARAADTQAPTVPIAYTTLAAEAAAWEAWFVQMRGRS